MVKWQESFSFLLRRKEGEVRAPQLIDNVEKRENGSFDTTGLTPATHAAHPSGGLDVVQPNTPFIVLDGASGSTPSATSFNLFSVGSGIGSLGTNSSDVPVMNYTGDFFYTFW